jgi:O-antigen ligase
VSRRRLRGLLGLLIALTLWGPPSLRTGYRALDTSLASPLALDLPALLQVGTWALAMATIGIVLTVSALARETSLLRGMVRSPGWTAYLLVGVAGVLSTLWSVAPLYTLYFAMQVLVVCMLGGLFMQMMGPAGFSRILRIVFVVHVAWMIATVLLYLVNPSLVSGVTGTGDTRLYGGILGGYGLPAVVASVFFLSGALRPRSQAHRAWSAAGYVGCWGFLVASQTRAALGLTLLSFVLVSSVLPGVRSRLALAVSTLGVALTLFPLAVVSRMTSTALREGQGLTTLSGRSIAWDRLILAWRESPWTGHGYAAGSRAALVNFYEQTGLNIGAGHDSLSTMLADLGLVGVALLSIALAAAWIQLSRIMWWADQVQHRLRAAQLACLLAVVTLGGITSQVPTKASMLFVVVLVCLQALENEVRQARAATLGATSADGGLDAGAGAASSLASARASGAGA